MADRLTEQQRRLTPALKALGYRVRGRAYNRATTDGLVQVIGIQGGRSSLEGSFTVEVGVHAPEVQRAYGYKVGASVQPVDCCVRDRLGNLGPEARDRWWPTDDDASMVDVEARLRRDGLPFLARLETRDQVVAACEAAGDEHDRIGSPPRIVAAIILATRGDVDRARALLRAQLVDASDGHARRVRELAVRIGVAPLDG